MKQQTVTLSPKYQVVIPKIARKKLGLHSPSKQRFTVTRVTDTEIVFTKAENLDDFLGAYGDSFPIDATSELRRQRDGDWE